MVAPCQLLGPVAPQTASETRMIAKLLPVLSGGGSERTRESVDRQSLDRRDFAFVAVGGFDHVHGTQSDQEATPCQ